jgi:hypothetical protein
VWQLLVKDMYIEFEENLFSGVAADHGQAVGQT